MIDWTIPETITASFVIVFALGLIYKFLGQRTDPKLLELFELQTKANTQRDQDRTNTYERLAAALDRNTDTLDTVKSGLELAFSGFAQSIQQMVSSITTEHQTQLAAIGGIPGAIIPTIEILTQQLEGHKGNVEQMTDTVEDQNGAIQQILAAVLRLEAQMTLFQTENQRLGVEIQEAQTELATIKADVSKLKPAEKPKSLGVPVTPKPNNKKE